MRESGEVNPQAPVGDEDGDENVDGGLAVGVAGVVDGVGEGAAVDVGLALISGTATVEEIGVG